MQQFSLLINKKNHLMFNLLTVNLVLILTLGLINWIFRKSALKRELFGTLILLITIIISYFVVYENGKQVWW